MDIIQYMEYNTILLFQTVHLEGDSKVEIKDVNPLSEGSRAEIGG